MCKDAQNGAPFKFTRFEGPLCLVYAFSEIYEFLFMIVFLLYANDCTLFNRKLSLVCFMRL